MRVVTVARTKFSAVDNAYLDKNAPRICRFIYFASKCQMHCARLRIECNAAEVPDVEELLDRRGTEDRKRQHSQSGRVRQLLLAGH